MEVVWVALGWVEEGVRCGRVEEEEEENVGRAEGVKGVGTAVGEEGEAG